VISQNENVSTCILGASKPEQVADNCKALKVLPKLTPEVMEKIEKVLDNKPAQPVSRPPRLVLLTRDTMTDSDGYCIQAQFGREIYSF